MISRKIAFFKMLGVLTLALISMCFLISCDLDLFRSEEKIFNTAMENGRLANEGFIRCSNFVKGWLKHVDAKTGLIPKNFDWERYTERYKKSGRDIWTPEDNAADNYSFMVLTSAIIDRDLLTGSMLNMLRTETRLTSRIGKLPDTYSFSKEGFLFEETDIHRIMFSASEYVKDGLLPITEWLGQSPWSERMMGILDDMWRYAPIDTPYGKIVSTDLEVNGEMLQTLPRIYWMTGKEKYLEWAIRLGDYYLLGNNHPTKDITRLKLRDHGCEIVSGLCELYATLNFVLPAKKQAFEKPIHEMLDRILLIGRNDDGLFYNIINPREGKKINGRVADTWGYTMNGYYTVYLIDGTQTYRRAVLKALDNLPLYNNFNWQGDPDNSADGYADSIEGALNLYNRERISSVAEWIDREIQVMWSKQRPDGIIEGWHCDGNFARTTLMYCLWKTKGITILPWRKDVIFGSVQKNDKLMFTIISEKEWNGRIIFDSQRHKTNMGLPLDWPRINQFSEWYTIDPEDTYTVENVTANSRNVYTGKQLVNGININLKPGEGQKIQIY